MSFKFYALLLALVPSIQAIQVANLNVSESIASKYGCDSACYKNFQEGLSVDAASYGAIYDTTFYETAHNFSSSKPGDALKLEPVNATLLHDIPKGTTAYRFQYVSKDLDGKKIPVTGFIAFPYASRLNGHVYPAIAYGHGTSGVFQGCAPSAMPSLYEYGSWAFLVSRGYAVIATDYAGLGNNYTAHPWQASPAQAHDLYYSVAAARKLFGGALTDEWMSVGHSQGGGAAWTLAESSLLHDDPLSLGRYLGTVALAPGVRLQDMVLAAIQASSSSDPASARSFLGEAGFLVLGLRSILPNDPQTWLQPKIRKRLELATLSQACYDSMMSLVADLDITDFVNISDPSLHLALEKMQAITARGESKSPQPIFIAQGLSDGSVLARVVEKAYHASCQSGNDVHIQTYPGIDHDPVIPASAPAFLQWIDDRFDGIKVKGGYSNKTIQPFDSINMYAPSGSS
ncbi:hypothetical protein E8E15_003514 [Penicillium rubens]|jgi:pimeloyl-ACP methyl ester carboxylesterase|uniref:Pc20g11130 protein n=2 Tax=Penicillium chrysogenum species complex TaxID=254878 RepID=B6HG50_PENRW|nr:uncharacterized protein N7525_009498 [Penicillium rubens]KZN86647.1 hypothetical protein EN45_051850 [Penicillium chrysogenum]CAP86442.1 Pc20g11130 [Penicillium rubens Wisconsin 54-1255]KAF3026946.1 hypothetical protein E8E15_003514 [Penicillium rubens]KAJ5053386.1 hypothetical protein NUH16_010458 [Penicillium rubens]KAJ5831245.1 hypothetical protein N7525_009498 [Penicillium rubens]